MKELELAIRYYESATKRKDGPEEQEKKFNEYKAYVENLKRENQKYNEGLLKDLTKLRDLKLDSYIEKFRKIYNEKRQKC